jgi:hypothetical protein
MMQARRTGVADEPTPAWEVWILGMGLPTAFSLAVAMIWMLYAE